MNTILTLERIGIALVLTLALSGAIKAQIHVDSLKDVGIGTDDPEGAKMKIQTTDESKALYIYNNSPDSISKYGIYINTRSAGVGEKYGMFNYTIQNSSSDNSSYGLYNDIIPNGTGTGYGIYNHVQALGLGPKYGIFNNVFSNDEADAAVNGIYNITRNGRNGHTYGIYNYARLLRPVLDDAVGFFNYVAQTTNTTNGHIFGIDNLVIPGDSTSDRSIFGIRSTISDKGDFIKYGVYSDVTKKSNSSKEVYGFYTEVNSTSGSGGVYGTASKVTLDSTDTGYGVYGSADANGDSGEAFGVYGTTMVDSLVSGYGVYGLGGSAGGIGEIYGVKGKVIADSVTVGYAVYGEVAGTNSANSFAGFFDGDIYGTKTLYIDNNSGTSDSEYGIQNIVRNSGTGAKYGIDNSVTQGTGSTEDTKGIHNCIKGAGTGTTYGIFNLCDSSALIDGPQIGIENLLFEKTPSAPTICPQKYGIKNTVHPDANTCSGFYGIYNSIGSDGDVVKYGVTSHVTQTENAIAKVYGVHSTATSEGGDSSVYAVYGTTITPDSVVGYAIYGGVNGAYADSSYAGFFDGRVVTTATYSSLSDIRVKKNVEVFSRDATALIKMLRPVTYEFDRTALEAAPRGKQLGFIAQEIESVIPEVVSNVRIPGKPTYETVIEDIETNGSTRQSSKVVPTGEEPSVNRKALNYEALIPILVKAIQEQEEEISSLRAQLEAQKVETDNRISSILKQIESLEKK